MKSYTQLKKRLLKDSTIRQSYDDLKTEFSFIETIIEKRLAQGLTQTALAKKIGTKQSSIARFESGNYNASVAFLEKIAKALDTKLVISLA